MKCKHPKPEIIGYRDSLNLISIYWCPVCGALRIGRTGDWRLPEKGETE